MPIDLEHANDDELVAAVAAGDGVAFGALFHRRSRDVYRFARHMTGSPAAYVTRAEPASSLFEVPADYSKSPIKRR